MNEFLPLAIGIGANVIDQATYAASPVVDVGYQSGLAQSSYANKTWRQATFVASQLAQFMADQTGQDVLDDGDTATFLATLTAAIQQASTIKPARLVTSSAPFTLNLSDGIVGFNRASAPAAQAVAIPAGVESGQEFKIQDVLGNFFTYPVTISPPGGSTIAGLTTWVCAEDKGTWTFSYYGSNIFGVQQ